MHNVVRTRASCARRNRHGSLQLLAAVACWLLTGTSAVAQTSQPSAAPPPAADPTDEPSQPGTPSAATSAAPPPCNCQLDAWHALERDEPRTANPTPKSKRHGDPAGSLGWEIAGGVIPSVAGIGIIAVSLATPSRGGGDVPTFNLPLLSLGAVVALLGPPTGVAIAGSATGGTGGAGYAFLGGLGGFVLGAPGIVVGSIIGYRLSADDEFTEERTTLTPFITLHEVGLQWSGVL